MRALAFVILLISSPVSGSAGPSWGDHVCWSKHPDRINPVMGWHAEKSHAAKASLALCEQKFGKGCALEYCEKLEKDK